MKDEQAATIALQALAFIAGEENALIALMNLSGLSLDDMKSQAGDPQFLAGTSRLLRSCRSRPGNPPKSTPRPARWPGTGVLERS